MKKTNKKMMENLADFYKENIGSFVLLVQHGEGVSVVVEASDMDIAKLIGTLVASNDKTENLVSEGLEFGRFLKKLGYKGEENEN